MSWLKSFEKEERERKAQEHIKQLQEDYSEELDNEMEMEGYSEKKHKRRDGSE